MRGGNLEATWGNISDTAMSNTQPKRRRCETAYQGAGEEMSGTW